MIIIIHTIISIFVINYSYIYIVIKFSFIDSEIVKKKKYIYIKNRKNISNYYFSKFNHNFRKIGQN